MINNYIVAGIPFRINWNEEFCTKEWLVQYQPFLVSGAEENAAFTFTFCAEGFDTHGKELLYKEESDERYMRFEIYQDKDHYIFLAAITKTDGLLYHIVTSRDFSDARLYVNLEENGKDSEFLPKTKFIAENFIRILFSQNAAPKHVVCLHASAMRYKDKAYLFMGHSGSGKSTHSRLWLKYFDDTELMNDDNPVVALDADGKPVVYGSPWSGKTICYKKINAPLAGIAHIVQRPENKMVPYPKYPAYRFIHRNAFGFTYLSDGIADGIYYTVEKIISQIPIYQLQCRADKEAAKLCKKTLVK
ncbi:MAG: hypothetical protein MJZ73_01310 [Bacteroidaceae bacterium]|nr:hypothetical protein [Bacteroidaceae bacterium]